MKTTGKFFLITFLCIGVWTYSPKAFGQFNSKINTKNISNSTISELSGAILINKVKENDFKDILVKDISKATTKNMKVAGTYFRKKVNRSWKITPGRAFGPGHLGFSMYSGQLYRDFFFIEAYYRGEEQVAYSGHISFDARNGRTYLIKIVTGDAYSDVYINALAGDTPFKVHGQNGSYPILLEANESGEMKIGISARLRAGQTERFPEPLLVKEILINEL